MTPSKEQQAILEHKKGHAFVHAGAGCGKTSVLLASIGSAIQRGLPANAIIVLTYNRATVTDFKYRLTEEIGDDAELVKVHTFHSFGKSIIFDNHTQFGFTSRPKVKDENYWPQQLIDDLADEYKIDSKQLRKAFFARNNDNNGKILKQGLAPALKELLTVYPEFKRKHGFIDFDDMQELILTLFSKKAPLRKESNRYQFLLVDELQDINDHQAKLLGLLAPNIETTLMVGDSKQSIYRFRDASPKHWQRLQNNLCPNKLFHLNKLIKPTQIFYLTETFRCPVQSMGFINAVAAKVNKDTPLLSHQEGQPPSRHIFKDSDDQNDFLAKTITELLENGISHNEIAILAKNNSPLRVLKLALEGRGIDCIEKNTLDDDYRAAVNNSFKLIRCLLRVTRWQADRKNEAIPEVSIKFILKVFNFTGEKKKELLDDIVEHGWNKLGLKDGQDYYRAGLAIYNAVIEAGKCQQLEHSVRILLDAAMTIINKRHENLKEQVRRELIDVIIGLRGLDENKVPLSDINIKSFTPSIPDEGITLVTAHSAKGREWQYVFLIHVVDEIMPHRSSENRFKENAELHLKEELEEERRVFYVAITRHSKQLWICQTPIIKPVFKPEKGKSQKINRNLDKESCFVTEVKKKHLKVIKYYPDL